MSIILEALKKAESERHAGGVPGLHAPVAAAPQPEPAGAGLRTALPWLLLGGCLALAAALAWSRWQPTAPAASAPAPTPPVRPAAAVPQATAVAAASLPSAGSAPAPAPTLAPASAPIIRPAPAASADAPLMTLAELPPELRAALPPLVIGGYIFAEQASERTVILNQRLLHEGDEVAPGLRLESMRPEGMVLNFRGQRFRRPW